MLTKNARHDTCLEYGELVREWNASNQEPRIDTMPFSKDESRQFAGLLLASDRYDGFILDGSEGDLMVRIGNDLGLRCGVDYHVSGYATGHSRGSGVFWHRNSYELGYRAWQMLMRIIHGEESPGEELLPLVKEAGAVVQSLGADEGLDI